MDFEKLNKRLAEMTVDEFSEWEASEEGVLCMHARIIDCGRDLVAFGAPVDWAWQLIGILGCGYSAVTEESVEAALLEEGWLKEADTTFGALAPWGGAWVRK